MNKIGFGEQPYLVYEHRDAGHPHIHIVTTSIQESGRRIDTYNIGRNQSQKARKEIEDLFGLVKATGREEPELTEADITVQKIRYGKTDTRQSVGKVLYSVINRYCFASLPELNAVLKLYNLMADTGTEISRTRYHGGLTYRVLDDAGNKVGVPLKASSFYFKPTLNDLEKRFTTGAKEKLAFQQKLKTAIDFALAQKPDTLDRFAQKLKDGKVTLVRRANADGFVYGLTFIDHRTACVFNGSDLGKEYSAAAVQRRLSDAAAGRSVSHPGLLEKAQKREGASEERAGKKEETIPPKTAAPLSPSLPSNREVGGPLTELIQPEKEPAALPFGLHKKKKKKRGRQR